MPTYQYVCTQCGHDLEVQQSFSEASLTECPACAGRLRKVFNAVGVVFKGSGFYRNDSRSGGGSDSGGDSASKDSKDSGSKDSKDGKDSGSKESGSKESSSAGSGSKDSGGGSKDSSPSTPAAASTKASTSS